MLRTSISAVCTAALFVVMSVGTAKCDATVVQTIVTAQYYSREVAPPPTAADLGISTALGAASVVSIQRFDHDYPAQLYLVIDDCSDLDAGSAVAEMHAFLRSRPANTTIGSAYIREGHIDVVRRPTGDRESVISSLAPPAGCRPASPFGALSELIRDWQPGNVRRIVILVSNGIDPSVTRGYKSDSAEEALAVAQRAGVVVYTIYHPARQYEASSFSTIYSGQVLLSHLAFESGGQGYFLGAGPLGSVAPFLSDIADHLEHQYRLEFTVTPPQPGEMRSVFIRSNKPAFEIVAPSRIWIGAASERRPN